MIFLLWRHTVCTIYKIAKRAHGIIVSFSQSRLFTDSQTEVRGTHRHHIWLYSRLPISQTFKGNKKRFELRELGENSWKQKKQFFSSTVQCQEPVRLLKVDILITFTCTNVK